MNQFEDMQTFVRVVEAGSITKAADQMNTAKSAISRRIAELEKRLGVQLLIRTTRSQTLTDSGQSYYEQCLRLIEDVAEVESQVKNEHCALRGHIKVAAPLSFGLQHLGPAIRRFNEVHPDIYFDIDFNDRLVDLVEEGFDLAIRISKLQDSTLIARKITNVGLVLAASPGYLKKHGTPQSLEDLQDHFALHYRGAPDSWPFKDKNGKEVSIKVPSILTANNGDFLTQSAIDDKGIIMSPDFLSYKAIKLGQLVPILTDYMPDYDLAAYAVYPHTRHLSHRVRSFVEYLQQYFGDKPYWQLSTDTQR